ncbi:MAG: cytochrome C [Vicinamibacterales bacterium]
MKTLLKIVGVLVAVVVLAAGAGFGYLMFAFPKAPPPAAVTLEPTPERLARGKYLSDHVTMCTDCHSERDWTKFSGPVKPGRIGVGGQEFALGGAGTLYAKNITPAAIGSWTDGELQRAVTAGVSKDGTPLFPLMPYPHFGAMAADDMHAILVYVRSWQAIESQVTPRTLNFPMNLIVRTIPAAGSPQPRPSPEDKVAYGRYMTRAALCADCHTPMDDRGQPVAGRDFAGGNEFVETGYRVRSANITPDSDTGIGSWTEQQFIDKFKGFETPSDAVLSEAERRQNTPMPWTGYAGMTREDLSAIYAFLRTQAPVTSRINKFPDAQ